MSDLPTRVADLRAVAEEHMPGTATEAFARIICDGCGATVDVDPWTAEPSHSLDGWTHIDGAGDYCEPCTRRREKGMVVT